jgi:hypothetical protein
MRGAWLTVFLTLAFGAILVAPRDSVAVAASTERGLILGRAVAGTSSSEAPTIDERLYQRCVSAALGSIGQGGYKVVSLKSGIIEWSFAPEALNPECAKYGTQAVRFYAASFEPKTFPKNPHRLGGTITFMNPTSGRTYTRRQKLSRPIQERAILSDVETTVWIPKASLGRNTKTYSAAGLQGAFNP